MEKVYEKLHPKAIKCMYLSDSIGFIITAAILITARILVNNILTSPIAFWVNFGLGLVLGLYFVILLISPPIRYRRYCYLINNEKIDVIEGLFFIKREIVPIERIQKIETKRGPVDNIFGLAKVIVTTAGGDTTISFLELAKADMIADTLKTKINQIVNEQRQGESNNV